MSESDGGPGRREVAQRLFAAEFEDADLSYSESDEERAPNYVVTPSGARVNRLFVVGVLTEVQQVSEDVLRARVVDPSGAFVLYAGQYQPDEQAFLDRADPPMFVAVTGKARTFTPEDSEEVYTSVRPETISEVDAETRDRWVVETAERTIERVGKAAAAARIGLAGDELEDALREQGYEESLAAGIPVALDHYGTTGTYLAALRDLSLDAARLVAGDIEEVEGLVTGPAEGDDGPLGDLVEEASLDTGAVESADTSTDAETPEEESPTAPESASSDGAEAAATDEEAEPAAVDDGPEPAADEKGAEVAATDEGAEDPADFGASEASDTEASEPSVSEAGAASAAEADDAETAGEEEDIGDFDPGEFDLDDDEREEVEEEFGTEFQTGTEVEDPGEADIDAPEPDSDRPADAGEAPDTATSEPEPEPEHEPKSEPEPETPAAGDGAEAQTAAEPAADADEGPAAETAAEPATGTPSEPAESAAETTGGADDGAAEAESEESAASAEDVNLEDAAVDAMAELDDGDGADRQAVVDHVADRYGAEPEAVDEAIQDALMDGRCYEPGEGTLKPI